MTRQGQYCSSRTMRLVPASNKKNIGGQQQPSSGTEEARDGPSATVAAAPRPMDALHDPGPPSFLTKTYDMVDDLATDPIVSWSATNNSFVVWDPHAFATMLLPRHFKHNNFSSYVRQLNTYIENEYQHLEAAFGNSQSVWKEGSKESA